jgi:hypothetical protein
LIRLLWQLKIEGCFHQFFSAAKGDLTLQPNLKRIIAKGFAEVNFSLIIGFTGAWKEIALYRKYRR